MNTPAARGAGQGSEMRIDAIDIYWARLRGRGEVATSKVPGIAQEPDPDLLQQWTAAHAAVRG